MQIITDVLVRTTLENSLSPSVNRFAIRGIREWVLWLRVDEWGVHLCVSLGLGSSHLQPRRLVRFPRSFGIWLLV